MKIIIDIPEWKYKSICEGVEASKRCGVVGVDPDIHEAIYNGTMLDSVKAEFINQYPTNQMGKLVADGTMFWFSLNKVLEILDNIGKESEGI